MFETRVERASKCREYGSNAFKTHNINKAIEWYERALYHVDFDEGTWHFEVNRKLWSRSFNRSLAHMKPCYIVRG